MSVNWVNEKGNTITKLPNDCFGFIYKISYKDGTYYFGKKQVTFKKTLPRLKNGDRRPNSKLITKRVPLTQQELDSKPASSTQRSKLVEFEEVYTIPSAWKKYTGSSEDTPPDSEIKSKTILFLCSNKRTLTYLETYVLFNTNAVCKSNCHNKNVLGKFFDNALDGWIKEW